MSQSFDRFSSTIRNRPVPLAWGICLVVWCVVVCFVPDPRPLGAPDWSVKAIRSMGLSEPGARAVATIGLRGIGIGLIGVLLALTLTPVRLSLAAPVGLIGAVLISVACQWINYGYFPIDMQIQLGIASAIIGSLAGLALRRSAIALTALVVFSAGLFLWGTSTGIPNDLYESARATGQHVLANAGDVSSGDEGFEELLRLAFSYAEDNSHRTDAVEPNKAAILALGVILGEERVASVAKREIDIGRRPEMKALYQRISIRGRNDLVRHFWVSAALAILSDDNRSMAVGITKEMMDATEGGSGFSFVDLTADRAGTLFAGAATKDAKFAREMQQRIRRGINRDEIFPQIDGLPEGIMRDEFQTEYGGLGGAETKRIVEEIQRRLAKCSVLEGGR